MEIPGQLEINGKVYQFNQLTRYQKPLYVELVRQIKIQQQMKKKSDDSLRQEGVIGYLYTKLEQYSSIEYIKNIYDNSEVTSPVVKG